MREGPGHMVGRDAELAVLCALLEQARSGHGKAAMLMGEAGIGKTTLAEAVERVATDQGLRVTWGRCPEAETPAYWPWSQALRQLDPAGENVLHGEHHGARAELFAAVVEHLERITEAGPAVVLLEDVHWADAPSLALLQFVVGAVPSMPLLLVLSTRDEPLELTDIAAAGLGALPSHVLRIRLHGLDREGTAALVEHVTRAHPPDELVDQVHERTRGNPFFVTEVARLHAVRGPRTAIDVPPGVHEVISRRLARLSQPASDLLGAAAVLGEPVVDLLSALTGRPGDDVTVLLDEAVRARLVEDRGSGYDFTHALVRETLYEDLSPGLRARLHREVAQALELRAETRAADLALHWARAGGAADRRRAAAHALQAAGAAVAHMGYEQAVLYYRWALEGGGAGDPLGVRISLGAAQVLGGDLTGGRETLRQAAYEATRVDRAADVARAVLGMGAGLGGFEVDVFDDDQMHLLTAALDALPRHDTALRGAALARLSLASAGRATPEERADLAREAIAVGQRLGDSAVEISALASLCDALAGPDHVTDRLTASDRMVELAVAGNDVLLLLLARRLRLVARLEAGDLEAVDAEIAAYARSSDRLRVPLYAWPVPIWRGMRAVMRGDLDHASRCSEQAAQLGRRAGSANAQMMVFTLEVAVARARGTPEEIFPHLVSHQEDWSGIPASACLTAAILAEVGRTQEARRSLNRTLTRGIESLPRDSEWLEAVWCLGDAAILLGERDAARLVRDALQPYSELWAVDGMGGACFGQVSTQLDRLEEFLEQSPRRPVAIIEATFRRDGRVWHARYHDVETTVPDSKGMRDVAMLLARPNREIHVLELIEAAGGLPARAAEADVGPTVDAQARAAYRARLVELEQESAAAERLGDIGTAATLRAERDAIAAELARALGLGGRPRIAGDRVERARKAVTMRIRAAIAVIEQTDRVLGRHLRMAVRTGRFCAYRPEQPTIWRL